MKLEAEFLMTEILANGKILDKKNFTGIVFTHFDKWDMDGISGPYLGFFVCGGNSTNLHRDLPYTDRVSSQTLC